MKLTKTILPLFLGGYEPYGRPSRRFDRVRARRDGIVAEPSG